MDVVTEGREPAAVEALGFPLLRLVVEARNEHGLRQQDWSRYRQYCATKTKRVRSALELTHGVTPKAHGKPVSGRRSKRAKRITPTMQSEADKKRDHTFIRRDIGLEHVTNTRPLELLLFESEHCWAAAEELASMQNEARSSKLRRSSMGRARRAIQYADKLHKLAEALPALTAMSRAQCLAYVGLVRGAYAFLHGNWEQTLRVSAATRCLLTIISECSTTSRDEALASSFLDSLDAQIRFAVYSLGAQDDAPERASDSSACEATLPGFHRVTEALKAAHPSSVSSLTPFEVHWRTQTIPIHSLELHDVILRVKAEEAALAQFVTPTTKAQTPDQEASGKTSNTASATSKRARLSHAERNSKRRGHSHYTHNSYANRAELDPFDRVLAALTDAESMARVLVDDNSQALAKTHSARYEATGLQLRRVHEWLVYRLLAVRIARNVRLWNDIQSRAAKREMRAKSLVDDRTHRRMRRQKGLAPVMVRAKLSRQYGHSGTRRRARVLRERRLQRALEVAAQKSERRRLRLVPGIAKLLDSIDSSLLAMGGLVMVEGEPDVSSLLEAKRFYYCSELLRQLAGAFTQHGQCAEALVLLQRADLYVRQAQQSLELAHGAEDEDHIFAPHLLASDALTHQKERLRNMREYTQASVQRQVLPLTPSSSMRSTKGGQSVYYHALRHVSFDQVDLDYALEQALAHANATRVDHDIDGMHTTTDLLAGQEPMALDTANEEEVINNRSTAEAARLVSEEQPVTDTRFSDETSVAAAPVPETVRSADSLTAPFDPANAYEEEEELRQERERKSRSWLSWWLGR